VLKSIKFALEDAVHALPEIYQPIYGHENKFEYKRESVDRLNKIKTVCENLQSHLKRKLRILDVGCAQGYLSFNLSKYCITIDAVDGCLQNIELCNLIKREFNLNNIKFHHTDALNFEFSQEYDIIIICNVIHHICHQNSIEATLDYLRKISQESKVSLLELTNSDENQDWSLSLPESNEIFTDIFEFSDKISEFTNHLNSKKRPLFIGSKNLIYFNETFFCFQKKLKSSHKFDRNVNNGFKSYFYCKDKIVKQYRGIEDDCLRKELQKEKAFYNINVRNISSKALIHNEFYSTFLVRDKIEGTLLYEFLKDASTDTKIEIIKKIINQLAYYEIIGFFHNDLRLWNILVDAKYNIHIIDYSSFSKNAEDIYGNSVYFSFAVLLTEIFKPKFLHFPFRLLPELSNLPKSICALIVYIINTLKNISFSELKNDYTRLTKLSFSEHSSCIFSEFENINNFLFSYYHHNQDINLRNFQNIKKLESSVANYEQLSKIHGDLVSKFNYYESSYHHHNRVILELSKEKELLFAQFETKKAELNTLKSRFTIFRSRLKWFILICFISILTFSYLLLNTN
jgi:O-antigen chain-terminating methyltransferase